MLANIYKYFSKQEESIQETEYDRYVNDKITLARKYLKLEQEFSEENVKIILNQFYQQQSIIKDLEQLLVIFKDIKQIPRVSIFTKELNQNVYFKLQGPVQIERKQNKIYLFIEFSFQANYPDQPPLVCILNKHKEGIQFNKIKFQDSEIKVHPYYAKFIHNEIEMNQCLYTLKSWQEHKNVISVTEELIELTTKYYPFIQRKSQENNDLLNYSSLVTVEKGKQVQQNGQAMEVKQEQAAPIQKNEQKIEKESGIFQVPLQGQKLIMEKNGLNLSLYQENQRNLKKKMDQVFKNWLNDFETVQADRKELMSTMDQQNEVQKQQIWLIQMQQLSKEDMNDCKTFYENLIQKNEQRSIKDVESADKLIEDNYIVDLWSEIRGFKDLHNFVVNQFTKGNIDLQRALQVISLMIICQVMPKIKPLVIRESISNQKI